MDAGHLLFHTEVCWPSRGHVLQRVFDVRVELKEFLMVQGKAVWASLFLDEDWLSRLCYLSDIFKKSECAQPLSPRQTQQHIGVL